MSFLFVDDHGATIKIDGNSLVVQKKDDTVRKIPIETIDEIYIFNSVQITSQCMIRCVQNGIPICYFSHKGEYFGRMQSTGHINVERQRRQAKLANTEFSLTLAKNIISGKIHNQQVILRRYARNRDKDIADVNITLNQSINKIKNCTSISEIMGYEGNAAKAYFEGISRIIDDDFKFKGRSRRPPKDEFNSMISLGYSILMNEIYSHMENKGLNPYFGFIHSDKEKHPTLVSDIIEEWRAIIVDSLVLSMISKHEIIKENFIREGDAVYIDKTGLKTFLDRYNKKMESEVKYLDYIDYETSYRNSIDLQINQLTKAIENEDATMYHTMWLR